ncbi:MAG: hypothetical protein JEZ01_03515 [Labilibaculum sp.]|nr:hypothetical protein [Labilibaculum sp.]MBI9056821.1 hypothetical protein [Labilibaculum sp.]
MNNKKPISKIDWNASILQLETGETMTHNITNANVIQRIRNTCFEVKKKGYEFTTSVPENGKVIIITRLK